MKELTIKRLCEDTKESLHLIQINPEAGDTQIVRSSALNIPGLELTGFWEDFPAHKLQVFSIKEMKFIKSLSPTAVVTIFEKMFTAKIPALIFVDISEIPPIVVDLANRESIPLLQTSVNIMQFLQDLGTYLYKQFAPKQTVHGGLMDVYGVGVLLTGESGIGKSEIALDLTERGHRLVADDVVVIEKAAKNLLIGRSEELLQDTIEVRGLGIVNIRKIFGTRAIRVQKRVELQIELLSWNADHEYERFGLNEETTNILDVDIPHIRLPIYPGKNISVIVETIALTYILKLYGEDPAKQMQEKLLKKLKEKSVNINKDMIDGDTE